MQNPGQLSGQTAAEIIVKVVNNGPLNRLGVYRMKDEFL
jgi:hypothetical protein